MKIMLGIPTNRLIKPKTAESIMKIVAYSKNIEFEILISTRGYNTSENRNYIASQAVRRRCDYLFFVDDDMILPENALERLLEANKAIIGGVYKTKYEVQDDVVEYYGEKPKEKGIFKVLAIGTGAMLINCEVFKKMPQPWFKYEWHDNGMVKRSHDWIFCEDAWNFGYKVFADNTLNIKHIGQKTYANHLGNPNK